MTLQEIKNYIIARIYPNTQQEITGQALQDTLTTMAEQLTTREDFETYKSETTEQIADRVTASEFEAYQDDMAEALANKQDILVSGENIKTVSGKSLVGSGNVEVTKEDVGLGNVDNTSDENKPISTAVATALLGKQDTLVSGENIKTINGESLLGSGDKRVMPATPSGDPQHYLYEAVGAVYNATDSDTTTTGIYGDTIIHKSGHWLLNEVGDLTNEDMCDIVANPVYLTKQTNLDITYADLPIRTNIPKANWSELLGWYGARLNVNMNCLCFRCSNLNTFILFTGNDQNFKWCPTSVVYSFRWCTNLTKILNVLNCENLTSIGSGTFLGCTSLAEVRLHNLKASISFADSPLSVESAIFVLENADSSATFTITFRADRRTIYEANADFIAARDAKPNITIMYN